MLAVSRTTSAPSTPTAAPPRHATAQSAWSRAFRACLQRLSSPGRPSRPTTFTSKMRRRRCREESRERREHAPRTHWHVGYQPIVDYRTITALSDIHSVRPSTIGGQQSLPRVPAACSCLTSCASCSTTVLELTSSAPVGRAPCLKACQFSVLDGLARLGAAQPSAGPGCHVQKAGRCF